jgi:hypothetical protein
MSIPVNKKKIIVKKEHTLDFLERIKKSDVLLVTSLSLLSYIGAFAYRIGALGNYNLHSELSEFELSELIFSAWWIIPIFVIISLLFFAVNEKMPKNLFDLNPSIIFFVTLAEAGYLYPSRRIPIALLCGFLIITEIIGKGKFIRNFFDGYGKISKYIIFIFLIGFFFNTSMMIGKISHHFNKSYLIVQVQPECVSVFTTKEKLYCFTLDRQKNEIGPSFRILYFQDLKDIEMVYEDVGPLHPKPTPTPTSIPTSTPTITPTVTETPIPTLTSTP